MWGAGFLQKKCGEVFAIKKQIGILVFLGCIAACLSGCGASEGKTVDLTVIYGAAMAISLLLLVGYCALAKQKMALYILLFASVAVVNIGYFWLSVSPTLEQALMANRLAYLGSVLLPLSMFFIIRNATNCKRSPTLFWVLLGISGAIFLIAASGGILNLYYKDVSLQVVNGVSSLKKVYGPLHPLYLVFLLGYLVSMVATIIRAAVKKTIDTPSHGVILAIAVSVNIGVWFIEQVADFDFEMLSLSYIISELFLLGVHLVVSENERLQTLVSQAQAVQSQDDTAPIPQESEPRADQERVRLFVAGVEALTPTEKRIYDAYIARFTTKEIMATLNITENTLKFHNKNIYGKLGVSSRKELQNIHQQISTMQTKE